MVQGTTTLYRFHASFCRAALNILDVINCLRHERDADLQVQLDVFEEELSADTDAMVESNKESIDINNHLDLFKAIYNKVLLSTHIYVRYFLYVQW